ncbi:hypothetical protein GCM10009696_00260 [Kocuria himachalensis]
MPRSRDIPEESPQDIPEESPQAHAGTGTPSSHALGGNHAIMLGRAIAAPRMLDDGGHHAGHRFGISAVAGEADWPEKETA